MKVRNDFVTNSSSSSFIISKSDNIQTKEDVFKYIQKAYRDKLDKLEVAKSYAEDHGHKIVIEDGYSRLMMNPETKDIEAKFRFEDELEAAIGCSTYDYLYINVQFAESILKYASYEEWISNVENNNDVIHEGLNGLDEETIDCLMYWYTDDIDLDEYSITNRDNIKDVLANAFIIFDEEGSRYHFHDIAEQLGKICISYCTHMG